MQEGKN